ncbi:MAG: ABC transporter transmembrane domain-containing protein [Defluviicoccus sp.]|nr:ABC transporter transmembrane domain-containing protein [Defluviicoccus sp.]MDE0383635.1 ABC transporter transmembrane domain-containing protein [Defluviicoccus sp.]
MGSLRALVPWLAPYRLRIAGAGAALVVAAGSVLVLGQGLRGLIDRGFGAGDGALLDRALAGLFVIIALLALATFGRFYLVAWIGERVVADLRRAVFDRMLALSPSFFESARVGEVLSRLTTDTTALQVVVGSTVSVALRNVLLFLGGTVLLFVTSPRLAALVFLIVPVVVLPIVVFGRRVRRLSRESQDRVADISAHGEETLNAIRTVQAFGHEPVDLRRFAARVDRALATALRRNMARGLLTAFVIVTVFSAVGVILWIGGHDVIDGRISPGELSAFVFYAVVVAGSVGAVSEVIGDLQRAAGATERLLELMQIESEIAAPAAPAKLPDPPGGAIAFEAVRFHYPSRPDDAALDGASFDIAPGERVALVGPSGAGKSTVFELLLRFYDPAAGRVRFDGVDLRDADPAALRARIGLVAQEPFVFSADAWDNIRYGRPGATDAAVRDAAEAAAAAQFLDALPRGFDTFLGEKGVRLSGGQRQRIAIARALLRDPALLLLDEATSALDSESERLVQDALGRLMAGRTTLVIAHRLATVQAADRIIVLDRGRIDAIGAHGELLRTSALYARLAALQFGEAEEAVRLGAG